MENVLHLSRCDVDKRQFVGGKAIGLAAMLRLGLNVPPGFVVTTGAYRDAVGVELAAKIDAIVETASAPEELERASAEVRSLFTVDMIGDDLKEQILAAYSSLAESEPATVAVRSSATAEDLENASFAGQQDTFLWVSGADSVLDNIVKCWSSLFTPQVIGYRRKFDVPLDGLAMAVVVQVMVPADSAGVMMTLDPVTGDRSTTYVEAALGLGEGVVKGDVTSDSFWIPQDGSALRSEIRTQSEAHRFDPDRGAVHLMPIDESLQNQPAISDEEAISIADLGIRLAEALGGPQDVEWALGPATNGKRELFLLQTRAETVWSRKGTQGTTASAHEASHVETPVDPDEVTLLHGHAARDGLWTLTNMQEAIPGVETPLTWSIWVPTSEYVNRNHYRFVGALSRREAQVPHRTQDWILGVFYGRAALRIDLLAKWADRVPGMSGSDLIAQFFSSLPEGVDSHPERKYYLRALLRRPLPFIVVPPRMRANRAKVEQFWQSAVRELQSADLERTVAILDEGIEKFTKSLALQVNLTQGAFLTTSKMLRKLLADTDIEMHEIVAGYGGHEETVLVDDMWSCSRGEITQDEFLRRHGYHAWREGELSNKSWRDDPSMVASQIEAYRARPASEDPRTSAKLRTAKRRELESRLLNSVPSSKRLYARLVLKLSAHYLPMRGVSKTAFLQGLDVIRSASRRAGELLVESGELDTVDDIFYLTIDEIRSLRVPHGRKVVAERRKLRARYEAVEIPDAWKGVPHPQTITNGELVETITGTPASPGTVEGYARVVLNPADAHVEKGEILLAKDTDPGWASLMFLSSALVADIGGIMSHTAVVARELGIPCVVNTKVATRHIGTGDLIRIDGAAGTIEVLKKADQLD